MVGDVAIIAGQGGGGGDTSSTMKEAAPEDIRGYDVRTGELRWTFHVVPRDGEFGHESWGNESWKFAGNLAAWCPLSADEELGYVYIPLTAPTASYFGGYRPGDNLYADTVVALDAKTGKRVWHFQTIHHDLGYDLIGPAHPRRHHGEREAYPCGHPAGKNWLPLRPRPRDRPAGMAD